MSRSAVPHIPDHRGHDHSNHDRVSVVRLISDDLGPVEGRAVRERLESCAECAALASDVRLLSAAVREMPTPRRTHDFRLSEEQARRASGTFLDRILRRLALPQNAALQPLAGAAVAIGLVLVFVGSALPGGIGGAPAAGQPTGFSAGAAASVELRATAAAPEAHADTTASAGSAAPGRGGADSEDVGGTPVSQNESSPGVAVAGPAEATGDTYAYGTEVPEPSASATDRDIVSDAETGGGASGGATSASGGSTGSASGGSSGGLRDRSPTAGGAPAGGGDDPGQAPPISESAYTAPATANALVIVGGSVAGAGALLLLLRLFARRRVHDPAFR